MKTDKTGKPQRASAEVPRIALRIFGYSLALGFVSLMFAPIMMSETLWLRLFFNGALLLIALTLYFADGAYKGERDCATRDMLDKRAKENGYVPSPAEQGRMYKPSKGPTGALLGALPWFLLAVVVAVLSVPYTYSLQDLPDWLAGYRVMPELGDALRYYDQKTVVPLVDWLRIGLRFAILPYVYVLGEVSDAMSLLIDRVSPLLVLIMPLGYAAGYLTGPRRYKRSLAYIAQIKAKPRKRLKKKENRGPKKEDKNQLI